MTVERAIVRDPVSVLVSAPGQTSLSEPPEQRAHFELTVRRSDRLPCAPSSPVEPPDEQDTAPIALLGGPTRVQVEA